jgi:hypothetical protein
MNIFILDDSPQRHYKFRSSLIGASVDPAHTATEAYTRLRHKPYDVVFLDHDLEGSGPQCGSGTEVVTAIAVLMRMGMYPSAKAIHCVHSLNPERADYMYKLLKELGLETKRCAEAWEEETALEVLAAGGAWEFPEKWMTPLEFDE